LGALGRIDAPEPNAGAVDLYCITVDHARLSGQVVSLHLTDWRK
jgi:hypothetical protein